MEFKENVLIKTEEPTGDRYFWLIEDKGDYFIAKEQDAFGIDFPYPDRIIEKASLEELKDKNMVFTLYDPEFEKNSRVDEKKSYHSDDPEGFNEDYWTGHLDTWAVILEEDEESEDWDKLAFGFYNDTLNPSGQEGALEVENPDSLYASRLTFNDFENSDSEHFESWREFENAYPLLAELCEEACRD